VIVVYNTALRVLNINFMNGEICVEHLYWQVVWWLSTEFMKY